MQKNQIGVNIMIASLYRNLNHVAITYFISVRMPCQFRENIDANMELHNSEDAKMMEQSPEEKDLSASQNKNTIHLTNSHLTWPTK
jgi:hypothetical protein